MTILTILAVLNGGELVFWSGLPPSEGRILGYSTLPRVTKVSQSAIPSVITLVFSAKSTKGDKVVIPGFIRARVVVGQRSWLPPQQSVSSVIKSHSDRLLPDRCPFLLFRHPGFPVILLEERRQDWAG